MGRPLKGKELMEEGPGLCEGGEVYLQLSFSASPASPKMLPIILLRLHLHDTSNLPKCFCSYDLILFFQQLLSEQDRKQVY